MRTLLTCPMWLESKHEDAIQRYCNWLDFILPLKERLGYDEIFMVDNASTPEKVNAIQHRYLDLKIHRCKVHIARREHLKYGYYYAAAAISAKYAIDNKFDKILYIDSDMYPLNDKMCDYTRNLDKGWTGLYCHKHNFPETTYQIICKDQIQAFYDFHSRDFLRFYPDLDAESQTPFTHVEKGLCGDRFGEQGIPQQPEHDYYGQATPNQTLVFNMEKK